MKKILIFHPYLAPYRLDLYNRLAERFLLKVILTGSAKERATLGFDLDYVNGNASFDFEYVDKGYYLGRHLISRVYGKVIRSFKPDIVIAHELGINTIVSILLKSIFEYKLFVTIDDSPEMIRSYGKVRGLLQKLVVKNSDVLLVVHPGVKDYLDEKFSNSKCDFTYFPIIQDEAQLTKKMELAKLGVSSIKEKYGIGNKKIVLFVGRLEPVKCPEQLLQAFVNVADNESVLVFVGDGSLRGDLEAVVRNENLQQNVIFTGRLTGDELYAWYLIAHLFVLPSMFEPFGAVVNEALVAGCKVLVSDKVGANCLVNESNGVVFKAQDEGLLSNGLKELLDEVDIEVYDTEMRQNKMPISFNDFINIF